jgi:threonine dehydratase
LNTSVTLADIRAARERIRSRIYESPCPRSERLSRRTGCDVHLKLENLQMTGSFKERGARNRLLQLTAAERQAGVIAASAGNHAQGLAFHAGLEGIASTIVMPTATALIKVTATRNYGAEVVLYGDSYDDAAAEALRIQRERGLVSVPAFDDPAVIAGQGTIGLELLEQVTDLDAVVIPVGGGGLASGIAVAIKEQKPDVRIYGVEAEQVPSMKRALEVGHPVLVEARRTIAEGIGARQSGVHTFELARRYLDAVVLVDEEALSEAILTLLEEEKTVAEGAGAAALAALLEQQLPVKGQKVVVLVSGGNIDVNVLSRIIDRGLVKSGRMMRTRVLVPDLPGTLARLLASVATTGANVLSVHHDRIGARTDVGLIAIDIDLETRGFAHIAQIESALRDAGWHIEA